MTGNIGHIECTFVVLFMGVLAVGYIAYKRTNISPHYISRAGAPLVQARLLSAAFRYGGWLAAGCPLCLGCRIQRGRLDRAGLLAGYLAQLELDCGGRLRVYYSHACQRLPDAADLTSSFAFGTRVGRYESFSGHLHSVCSSCSTTSSGSGRGGQAVESTFV